MRVCGVATLYPHIVLFDWFRLWKYLLRTNTTHRESAATAAVVVAVAITRGEVEVRAVKDIIRMNGRRPNIAVRASVAERAITIEATSSGNKYLITIRTSK